MYYTVAVEPTVIFYTTEQNDEKNSNVDVLSFVTDHSKEKLIGIGACRVYIVIGIKWKAHTF